MQANLIIKAGILDMEQIQSQLPFEEYRER